MSIRVNKKMTRQELDNMLLNIRRHKKLDAKKFCGAVKWNEDGLKFQKRLRDEWN